MSRVWTISLILLFACSSTAPSPSPSIAPSSTTARSASASVTGTGSANERLILQSSLRAGWAYEAYPEASFDKMRGDFARMRAGGANAVWIGHNNPGEVNANKVEPGMSYAVFAALQDPSDPLYTDARAMADAVKRALDAARAAGIQVILPIGYQIQMGTAWNRKNPNELRVTFGGQPLNFYHSGFTASPYSEQYRADIARYYRWIRSDWLEPYRDVIVMLSLADEPMGGDYSASAQVEFARRYGKRMDNLAPEERWQLGEFQSGVIADYATWSANAWAQLDPNILTTMSFHGGDTARRVWGLPDFEKLFSQTPKNFVVTFDAYLHDDLASKPATPDEAAQLKLFLGTIGSYSKLYAKPIALWGGVNAWGLAQESPSPLGVPDAVTNLLLLYDLPTRMGGNVWGIFAWNYNVKGQGLENYARPTTYDATAMEIAVSRAFPQLRARPAAAPQLSPQAVVVVPARAMYEALARSRNADHPPAWFDATPYARALADRGAVIAVAPSTLSLLTDARSYILAGSSSDLDTNTKEFLRARLLAGANIFALSPSLAQEWNIPAERWVGGLGEPAGGVGTFYIFNFEE